MTIGDDEFAMRRERLDGIRHQPTWHTHPDVGCPLPRRPEPSSAAAWRTTSTSSRQRPGRHRQFRACRQSTKRPGSRPFRRLSTRYDEGHHSAECRTSRVSNRSEQMNRVQQDNLVAQVAEAVGECKIVDRRTRPQFGYRAVHLLVRRDERWVEIQVRTQMQDQWAQITESLGDAGTPIRYGQLPLEPDRRVLASDIPAGISGPWYRPSRTRFAEALELSIVRMQSEPDDELGQDIVGFENNSAVYSKASLRLWKIPTDCS